MLDLLYRLLEGSAYRDVPGENRELVRHLDRLSLGLGPVEPPGSLLTFGEPWQQAIPAPEPWVTVLCCGQAPEKDWLDERLPGYKPVMLLSRSPQERPLLDRLVLAATGPVSLGPNSMTLPAGCEWRIHLAGGRSETLWRPEHCRQRLGYLALRGLRGLARRFPPGRAEPLTVRFTPVGADAQVHD